MEDYKPTIPPVVRTATYYAGVAAAAAVVIFPDQPILVRIGAGVALVASSFGVAYRPTR